MHAFKRFKWLGFLVLVEFMSTRQLLVAPKIQQQCQIGLMLNQFKYLEMPLSSNAVFHP